MYDPELHVPVTLSAEDFDTQYDRTHKFPFFEDARGRYVYAYGHRNKTTFANEVTVFDTYSNGNVVNVDWEYTEGDVSHTYAFAYRYAADFDDTDWEFDLVDEEYEGAFPISVLTR